MKLLLDFGEVTLHWMISSTKLTNCEGSNLTTIFAQCLKCHGVNCTSLSIEKPSDLFYFTSNASHLFRCGSTGGGFLATTVFSLCGLIPFTSRSQLSWSLFTPRWCMMLRLSRCSHRSISRAWIVNEKWKHLAACDSYGWLNFLLLFSTLLLHFTESGRFESMNSKCVLVKEPNVMEKTQPMSWNVGRLRKALSLFSSIKCSFKRTSRMLSFWGACSLRCLAHEHLNCRVSSMCVWKNWQQPATVYIYLAEFGFALKQHKDAQVAMVIWWQQ